MLYIYYYLRLRPASIQHLPQLPMEHTTHAVIKGAELLKHIAITSHQVLILLVNDPAANTTAFQLPELRTRDPSATSPMSYD